VAATATARACANIAFIKYWGNLSCELRLPYNDSISMNLDGATSTTTVAWRDDLPTDVVVVDGVELDRSGTQRASEHLDRVRALAGLDARAEVRSVNTFPMGTGIASSASGFAALTVAATAAAGLSLSERELSSLARMGSGSAARSVPSGFVQWLAAPSHDDSFAYSIADPGHWDLRDVVAVVSRQHKVVGSSGGHAAADTSPYLGARLGELRTRLPAVRAALLDRDFAAFGPLLEEEALSLHAAALTSRPPILYWAPGTVALMRQAAEWRASGLPVYFTLDAGPNVHLVVEGIHATSLERELERLSCVEAALHCRPGGPAAVVPEALGGAG